MKTYLKKVSALFIAFVMMLTMCVPAFAADIEPGTTGKPVAGDGMKVTIHNLDSNATVTLYKLVDPQYDTTGFTGYKWNTNVPNTIAAKPVFNNGLLNLTELDMATLAGATSDMTAAGVTFNYNVTNTEPGAVEGSVKAESTNKVEIGTYLVVVNGGTELYNPMLVSVYYTTDGSGDNATIATGHLDANSNWQIGTTPAYAKSTSITLDKGVDKADVENNNGTDGRVVYTIKTTIPSYDNQYTSPVFKITDTLTNVNVDTEQNIQVKVGSTTYTISNPAESVTTDQYIYTPTVTDTKVTSFTLAFNSTYIKGLAAENVNERKVEITYHGIVTTDVHNNTSGDNTVTLNYSNKPNDATGDGTATDKTHTYSFDINGQIVKQDDNEERLEGAEFTLYREYSVENGLGNPFGTPYTTLENGEIIFAGLDGNMDGSTYYYLKETKAPTGYSLNDKIFKVWFEVSYDTDNDEIMPDKKMNATGYELHIQPMSKEGVNEGEEVTVKGNNVDGSIVFTNPYPIINTPFSELPSTGGIGTYLFTIIGVIMMAAAAGMLFMKRRRDAE